MFITKYRHGKVLHFSQKTGGGQWKVGSSFQTEPNSLQVTRSGVATGLVSIPNRYMHSAVETISLADLDQAADLLAGFALSLGDDETFNP